MSHTRIRNHFNYNYVALSFAALGHSSADVGGLDFSSTEHLLAVGVGDYENVNLLLRIVNSSARSATKLHGRNFAIYCILHENYKYYSSASPSNESGVGAAFGVLVLARQRNWLDVLIEGEWTCHL
jgi:hypothetical protein